MPTEIDSLRERTAVRMQEALRETADKVFTDALQAGDDTIFDRAEKAINATQQSDLFDTMRRLRLAKVDLASRAWGNLKKELDDCFRDANSISSGAGKLPFDDLTLVDPDVLEADIAISTAASRARARFAREWQMLDTRVDTLFAKAENQSPARRLGPELFAEAFANALHRFECTIEIRLVLLKLFERELVNAVERILAIMQQALTDAGVAQPTGFALPQRPRAPMPIGVPGKPASAIEVLPPEAGQRAQSYAGEIDPAFAAPLQDFFSAFNQPALEVGTGFQPSAYAPARTANVGEILNALAMIDAQLRQTTQPMPLGADVGAILNQHLQRQQADDQGARAQLRPLDAGVIDLIALMFEYAVNDRQLPSALQASIARLQIPYLKLALNDPQFLAKREHPARRLLDELAQSAVGWSESNDRGLKQLIDAVVETLTRDFKDDTAIFDQQRALLSEFNKREQGRAELSEKRAVQAADGKSKMESAQRDAAALLKQKLDGSLLPKALSSLVRERWSNYLVLTLLRHGRESSAWLEAVRILDLIARFPKADAGSIDRQSWRKELIDAESVVRKGLAATGVHDEDISEVLDGLHELLADIEPMANAGPDAATVTASQPVARPTPPPIPLEPVVLDLPVVDEPVLDDSQFQAALAEAQRLTAGTWVEMKFDETRRERVKLLWVSGDRRNYLFVNGNGIKVADKRLAELAEDIRSGRVAVMDHKPLVERAFEAAMARVRQLRGDTKKAN